MASRLEVSNEVEMPTDPKEEEWDYAEGTESIPLNLPPPKACLLWGSRYIAVILAEPA